MASFPSRRRALRVRKKMSGDRMPVKMIGDILTNQLPHMQPYIRFLHPSLKNETAASFPSCQSLTLKRFSVCRFCSCQLNGATLIQQKTDDNPEIKDFLKVEKHALSEFSGTESVSFF